MSQNTLTNYTAKSGAILGAGYILSYMLTHAINGSLHTANDISGNINSILLIAAIIIFTRKYRSEFTKDYFSYGEAFKVGFFISVFGGIIGSFFLYIYYSFISPESINQLLIMQQNVFLGSGMGEEQASQMTEIWKSMMTPGLLAFSGLLGNVIFGAIVSLISAAFLKKGTKGKDEFSQSMSEIDEKE